MAGRNVLSQTEPQFYRGMSAEPEITDLAEPVNSDADSHPDLVLAINWYYYIYPQVVLHMH